MREPNWLPFGHILEPPCLGRQVGGEQVPLRMLIKRVWCIGVRRPKSTLSWNYKHFKSGVK